MAKGFSSRSREFASKLLALIDILEIEKNRPVYFIEIQRVVIDKMKGYEDFNRKDMLNLVKDDLILSDFECNLFSVNPKLQKSHANLDSEY